MSRCIHTPRRKPTPTIDLDLRPFSTVTTILREVCRLSHDKWSRTRHDIRNELRLIGLRPKAHDLATKYSAISWIADAFFKRGVEAYEQFARLHWKWGDPAFHQRAIHFVDFLSRNVSVAEECKEMETLQQALILRLHAIGFDPALITAQPERVFWKRVITGLKRIACTR